MLRIRRMRRLFSLLCALCVMISLFPNQGFVFASAEETPQEAAVSEPEVFLQEASEAKASEPASAPPPEEAAQMANAGLGGEDAKPAETADSPGTGEAPASEPPSAPVNEASDGETAAASGGEDAKPAETETADNPDPGEAPTGESPSAPAEEAAGETPAASDGQDAQPAEADATGEAPEADPVEPGAATEGEPDSASPSGTELAVVEEGAYPAQDETATMEDAVSTEDEAADEERWNEAPITGNASKAGVTVRVSAPEGSFPQGTAVHITALDETRTGQILSSIGTGDAAVGFDICFLTSDGQRAQPRKGYQVSVRFSADRGFLTTDDGDAAILHVYHITDGGRAQKLGSAVAPEQGEAKINVQSDAFSPYVLVKEVQKGQTESETTEDEDSASQETETADEADGPDSAGTESETTEEEVSDETDTAEEELWNESPITGSASNNGVSVRVLAPEGSFPQGTAVHIDALGADKIGENLASVGAWDAAVGFDIFFSTADEQRVQPREGHPVDVSFAVGREFLPADPEGNGAILCVYHVPDGGRTEKIASAAAPEEGDAHFSFKADAFSAYIVAREPRLILTRNNRAGNTDLSGFLTSVVIDAPTDEQGNYIVNPNSTYQLTLKFSESEGLQFDDEAVLTYDLPEGLIVANTGATTFSINVQDSEGTATVSGNTFEIVDGQLRVRFNQNDPNFGRLQATANVRFDITISSRFDQTVGEIVFNPSIVKDFVFEDKSDLTIDKAVDYDMDSDTANYELTIRSEGLNENVVIEDHLTGTALIFNQDVVVESSINGPLSVTPDYTAVENGFRVTIPQMVDGEVLTLRYSAAVDNTKISSNGTVEQTNNTARVTSDQVPDGKEASADFARQADFQRVAKRATGEPVQIGENLYEQTWTVKVNEDHKMPMGGAYISDWIVQNSRPFMQFNGDGLTVKVTFEDGRTETRTVPWSDLYLWQDEGRTWGWRYAAPDSDGKASYEITCTTLIDASAALGDLTLVNGAQVYGSYDEGRTTVGIIGENVFGIQKDAIGTTSTESEWKITVTVPGTGLPDLRVVDDMPGLDYDGKTFIDYYVDNSMSVEGLQEGEAWNLYVGASGRTYTLTFYQNAGMTQGGVLPTADGQPRNIVVRFKTRVNQEWLNLASEDGYASPQLYRHRNYANARSGSYRTETVNATVVPIRPDFVKSFVERAEAEIDGVTYPVFRYSLTLLGPVQDGVVIDDSFNTDYLRFYEAEGVRIRGWSSGTTANESGTVSATDTTDGMDITVSSFPKQSDGSFYSFYEISYALIARDQEALSALNAAAAASQGGIDLENTAAWDDLTSSRVVNYTYFPYVDKELLSEPTAENGYVAEFKVIINKYEEDLDPASDVLTIQDVLSDNLRFIPESLAVSPANDSIRTRFEDDTNTLVFENVPDETKFEITYQARVLGIGNVTYSNTVRFGNYEKTVEESATVEHSGGGSASNPSITLVKRDAEDLSVTLAGATFQLFYMSGGGMVPVTNSAGNIVTFTTGADGRVLIAGNQSDLGWTLWEGRTYCLVEMAAPIGYEINEEPTYFVLSEIPSSNQEYDLTGDQFTVNNTRIKTSIPVVKQWIGPAAESVTVNLTADGVVVDTAALNAENDWQHTFADLDKYDNGVEIEYRIEEPQLPGYGTQVTENEDGSWTITNTNTETIEIPVTKRWVGPAAESVTVNLTADGVVVDTATLSAEDDWKHAFTGLLKYDGADGHEFEYDVQEEPVPGYDPDRSGTVETGFTFTNTITGKVSIPVTKQWIGPATESVTVNLLADGVKVAEAVLSAENNWQHTFAGLEQYNNGVEIVYTIEELDLNGYSVQITSNEDGSYTIVNTNTETTDIPVTKRWVGPAAESVTVSLTADGVVIDTATLSAENDWQHAFTGLLKYNGVDGHEIVYGIIEMSLPGYGAQIAENEDGSWTITNTNTETIEIPVTKQWVGEPTEAVGIVLFADETALDFVELNAENNWQHTFAGLLKYDGTDGHEIEYDVQEEPVPGYDPDRSGSIETGFIFTNTITGKVSVPVTKQWIGPAAESVTVNLTADGVVVDTATLSAESDWQHTFADLDKYDNGVEIEYKIEEMELPRYGAQIKENEDGSWTITNTNTETIDIPVTKQWVGPAAESVTVNLTADGVVVDTATLSGEDDWQHTFAGLLKYDSANGHEIVYDVQEVPVEGYEQGRSGSVETGFTFTNTITGKVSVPVTKIWIGPSAESVTVNLLADGVKVAEAVLSAENDWQHTFANLDKYDNGVEIEYRIEEQELPGYGAQITENEDGSWTITNTNTDTMDIPVKKQWVGPATASVTVNLTADGVVVDTATLSAENDWQHTFTGLLKHDGADSHTIQYDVEEAPVAGYEADRSGSVETGFTFTNTITGKVSIPVSKVWIGPAAQSVTVELLADGVKVAEAVLNAQNFWKHTFADLDKYDSGVEIGYTIQEVGVKGYSSSITGDVGSGFVIRNVNTETIDIPVEKRWKGDAAESVKIRLFADGSQISDTVLDKANNWKHTFTALSKYASYDGHRIKYTISEDALEGYTASIAGDMNSGFVVTNTETTTTTTTTTSSGTTPKTGDESRLMLYLLAMVISGAVLVCVILVYRARTKRQKK